ncbi:hypothetical protein M1247_21900 [Mycobacterium sp. 21AC1]|uniref:hypothetical protein n=1 Tax=[Mycobacterium] appelbergii TaxID=2939269 RepID=UPI0029394701|nr:hypothetical protein [Mycobacterium sp. 21AC1]MDV3127595.1 hypothetical protein [Mycobacterium sp. 21AC1]
MIRIPNDRGDVVVFRQPGKQRLIEISRTLAHGKEHRLIFPEALAIAVADALVDVVEQ